MSNDLDDFFDRAFAKPEILGALLTIAERTRKIDGLDELGIADKRSFVCGMMLASAVHLGMPEDFIMPLMMHPNIQAMLDGIEAE